MATWNGAVAIGMEEKIGSLEVGKFADIVAIDLSDPQCQPVFDPISTLVYASPRVSNVWIGGRHLVQNEKVVSPELQLDMNRVKAIGKRLHAFKLKREESRKSRIVAHHHH
jgi:5-methylthioadenosine/S-adenosylhomocysteine deaminase